MSAQANGHSFQGLISAVIDFLPFIAAVIGPFPVEQHIFIELSFI
jgi:hypothetical protein